MQTAALVYALLLGSLVGKTKTCSPLSALRQPGCGFPELELLQAGAYGEDFPYFHIDNFLNLLIYSISLTYTLSVF